MQELILDAKAHLDSIGGTIECVVAGLPMGLGAPDFDRNAETEFARQLFAIPAIKGLEFGDGFGLASMHGSQANDPWIMDHGTPVTTTNHNGGILGGITTGMPIVFRGCRASPPPPLPSPSTPLISPPKPMRKSPCRGGMTPALSTGPFRWWKQQRPSGHFGC